MSKLALICWHSRIGVAQRGIRCKCFKNHGRLFNRMHHCFVFVVRSIILERDAENVFETSIPPIVYHVYRFYRENTEREGDKATERVGRAENVRLLRTKQTIPIFHHKWTWISWVNLKSMSLVRWKKFYILLLISFYISEAFAYSCKYTTKGLSELSNFFELWPELKDWDDKRWKYQAKIFNKNSFLFIFIHFDTYLIAWTLWTIGVCYICGFRGEINCIFELSSIRIAPSRWCLVVVSAWSNNPQKTKSEICPT